jgi:predicted membrane chloride channel (bestrophin family)
VDEFSEWIKQGARLFGAESRLFVSSLLLIVMLAVTAAFVIAGALLVLVGAGVLLLIVHGGMDPVLAMVLASLVLFMIAVACFLCLRGLTKHLRFTESRRMLGRLTGAGQGDGEGA